MRARIARFIATVLVAPWDFESRRQLRRRIALLIAIVLSSACDGGARGAGTSPSSTPAAALTKRAAEPKRGPSTSPALSPALASSAPASSASASSATLVAIEAGSQESPANEPPPPNEPRPPEVPGAWSFAPLLRAERWSDARAALQALPAAERALPEVRFANARVALEIGEPQAALVYLQGLESALPALRESVAEARARAQAAAGQHAEAAAYFESRGDVPSLISSAKSEIAGGMLAKARVALDKALARLGKSRRPRSAETRARVLRAELATRTGDASTANADRRWLALMAPLSAEGDASARALESSRASRLTKAERLQRARALAEAGRVDATEAELALLSDAPGPAVPAGKLSYVRAQALYAGRRDYAKAAVLFERAAREDPASAAQALFFAARALSRAQLDERAITGYERVSHQFPKSDWAEQARYLSARLRFIAGEYDRARAAYDGYLAQYGKRARFAPDANYERALCALEGGRPLEAALAFEHLAEGAEQARDRRKSARLRYLAALARLTGKQQQRAATGFTKVAESEPLSFYGLAARARLTRLGAPLPPLIAEGHDVAHAPLAVVLPPAVAVLSRIGLSRDAERALTDQERTLVREYAPRGSEALCEAYGSLGVAARRYRIAQTAVRGSALDMAPTPANAWAWHCIYPTPYSELVRSAASSENVPEALLWAVMRQESAFNPDATSEAAAHGLLQLIAPTARRIADQRHEPFIESELENPDRNLRYGARYLSQLSGYFGGNYALMAAAYNAGPEAVYRWLETPENIGLDAFVARIPFEQTRAYVERVLGNLARYQYLKEGEAAVSPVSLDLPKPVRPPDVF